MTEPIRRISIYFGLLTGNQTVVWEGISFSEALRRPTEPGAEMIQNGTMLARGTAEGWAPTRDGWNRLLGF